MNYLNKMTVKELVEIAKRMNLSYSGLKKAELVAKLTEYINGWHVIAGDMNRELKVQEQAVSYWAYKARKDASTPEAIETAHEEALNMDAQMSVDQIDSYESPHFEYAGVVWSGPTATLLRKHDEMLRRYNPSMRRDKKDQIVLTPKQRRRIHKKDRRNMKRLGLWENAA